MRIDSSWSRCSIVLLLALVAGCKDDPPPPAPTVALAAPIRGAATSVREGFTQPITARTRIEQDATVKTAADARATLRLDGGAFVLLDRHTQVKVGLDQITLESGRIWVEARGTAETRVIGEHGEVHTQDGSFAAAIDEGRLAIYCGYGELTYTGSGDEGRLAQGETLALDGQAAVVEAADVWDDWTGGLVDPAPRDLGDAQPIGVLRGRVPTALGEARAPLSIRAQEVNVSVRGDLAITEVVQTFFNGRSEALEAEYAVRLPDSAIVSAFEVDSGAGFAPSVIAALGAEGAYQLDWRSREEPGSRLVYDGPGRLRARVFPVAPGAVVRVKLRYTEWLTRRGHARTYVYPMGAGDAPPLIGELAIRVDTSGTKTSAFRAGMGAEVKGAIVSLRRSDFRPRADFYLDLIDPEDYEPPEGAAAYHTSPETPSGSGEEAFALFDVPTTALMGDADADAEPLDLVLLVDVSGGTDAEDLELARGVVESILEQLAPSDRVTLRLGDVSARIPAGVSAEPALASLEAREAILDALARTRRGGASDLATTLREAATAVAGRPRGTVIYLGDGLPTTGELDATGIRRALAAVDPPPRFFGLAVGDDANEGLLRALFGVDAHAVRARSGAARTIMALLAEAARPTLRGVTFDLGPGVERIYPTSPLTIHEGEPLRLLARVRETLPKQIEIRGHRDGEPFASTMPVLPTQVADEGDIRRRWAAERLASLLDEGAGREAIIDLGLRFGVVTPFTARVISGAPGQWYMPIHGFDHDPYAIAWSLGGRGAGVRMDALGGPSGWRARVPQPSIEPAVELESTWQRRILAPSAGAPSQGDGGLARAGVMRALRLGGRGPEGCYERRLLARPDLDGGIVVSLEVDALGQVKSLSLVSSDVADADLEACVLTEVRGIQFPVTGTTGTVKVTHRFELSVPGRALGVRRRCSEASHHSLAVRRRLWTERLEVRAGAEGALETYREAQRWCELDDWRARRSLMEAMLRALPEIGDRLAVYRALESDPVMEVYLRRAILRSARSTGELLYARREMGLEANVEWSHMSALWHAQPDAEAKLRLIRRWLAVVPEDMDLRLHQLALLEETNRLAEARRLAHELRDDPLADATVRARVGELWIRQGKPEEARRVFSEIVERAPLDPWARRRLGDLYLAHGWADDAYREYQALASLRPDAHEVLLLLARAAAGAGRLDEALRLEQRLAEEESEEDAEGPAALARLFSAVRLARLAATTTDPERLAAITARSRASGAFRRPPDLRAAVTWAHPEDRLALLVRYPSAEDEDAFEPAPLDGGAYGIAGVALEQRDRGRMAFRVVRGEAEDLRETRATLTVVLFPGTERQKVLERELVLTRDARIMEVTLDGDALSEPVAKPVPAP